MTNTPTTFFGWIIFLIQQYHGYYLQGSLTTLETSLAGTICGCFLDFWLESSRQRTSGRRIT